MTAFVELLQEEGGEGLMERLEKMVKKLKLTDKAQGKDDGFDV